MSSSEGPIRRRRIAGESKPAAPADKVAAKKAPAKKAPAKKAAAKKAAAKVAPAKVSVAKPVPVKKSVATTFASKAPAPSRPPAPPRPAPRPVEATDGDSTGIPRRELRWLVPASLVAVAALVAGGWIAKDQISDRGGNSSDLTTSNTQAASAAGSAAQTIFSFTYDKLPQHLTASKALMTKSFAKEFDKIAPALTELAPQRKIQVQAVAREAGALACGDSCSVTKANILVFVDQARLVGNSKTPTVFGNRITVSMVKQHGSWLVADIRAL